LDAFRELTESEILARISHEFSPPKFEGAESFDFDRVLRAGVEKSLGDERA
jgi:hypothetical protein